MEKNLNTSTPVRNLNLYWCLLVYRELFTNFQEHSILLTQGLLQTDTALKHSVSL